MVIKPLLTVNHHHGSGDVTLKRNSYGVVLVYVYIYEYLYIYIRYIYINLFNPMS